LARLDGEGHLYDAHTVHDTQSKCKLSSKSGALRGTPFSILLESSSAERIDETLAGRTVMWLSETLNRET
jgi:hypothetical protein